MISPGRSFFARLSKATTLVVALVVFSPVFYLMLRASNAQDPLAFLSRASTYALLGRSLLLALSVSIVSVSIAALFTWLQLSSPFKRFFHVVAIAPLAIPTYVGASAYLAATESRGLLGIFIAWLNLPRLEIHGFWGATFVVAAFTYPLAYLPMRTAALRLDAAVYEAARTLGCSPLKATLTMARAGMIPSTLLGSALVALYAMSEFGAVSLLRYNSFPRVIFSQFQNAFDRGAAATTSLFLVLIILVLLFLNERLNRPISSSPRGLPWRLPRRRSAEIMGLMVGSFTLLIPLSALFMWAQKAPAAVFENLLSASWNSLWMGALCALIAALLAYAPARLAEAGKTRFLIRLLDFGFAIPGIVVALGFTFFALTFARVLYQTHALLIAAYVVLFLALALNPLRAALAKIPRALEENAQVLGASPWGVFRRVLLPLCTPGFLGAFALVLLSVMKELPATLLLLPPGERTLATLLWSYTDEALFAEASVVALAIILLSACMVGLLSFFESASEEDHHAQR